MGFRLRVYGPAVAVDGLVCFRLHDDGYWIPTANFGLGQSPTCHLERRSRGHFLSDVGWLATLPNAKIWP